MSSVTVSACLTLQDRPALTHKTMIKHGYLNRQIYGGLTSIGLVFTLLVWGSCGAGPFHPVSEMEEAEIKMTLKDQSFRQFDPDDIDASPRKAVVLNFFDGIRLWAQYAEGDYAINEWEIFAADYRVEQAGDGSEIKIYFSEPSSERTLPNRCEDCIETSEISISIRDVFDGDKISFKLNDPDKRLPSPFPVFMVNSKNK
ncbi:hypothetical protein J4G02_16180 [Candidatus Poribacteria bacterium]|nr:hypothetical protein [Candidatus Poribacteria bacterium]